MRSLRSVTGAPYRCTMSKTSIRWPYGPDAQFARYARSCAEPSAHRHPTERDNEDDQDVEDVDVQDALLQPAQAREAIGPAGEKRLIEAACERIDRLRREL